MTATENMFSFEYNHAKVQEDAGKGCSLYSLSSNASVYDVHVIVMNLFLQELYARVFGRTFGDFGYPEARADFDYL